MITLNTDPDAMTEMERIHVYTTAFAMYILSTTKCTADQAQDIMAEYCAAAHKVLATPEPVN